MLAWTTSVGSSLPRTSWLAGTLAILALGLPGAVSGQGLTYTVSPSARWIEWDDALGFKQSRLVGGAVGIGFGRYVGLQAFHHQKDGLRLFEEVGEGTIPPLFDLAQSGVEMSLALGSGTVVPVLVGGGSLLRFRPAEGEKLKKLSLDYGAGFRTVFGETLSGEVLVEGTQYRLDPGLLASGEPSFEGTGPLRRNMTLRASLGLQLGRRSFEKASELDDAFAQRYQAPFSNFALAVEPLLGRLDYDSSLGLENQEMVGVRAGFDFGSFFGLRGFHWWGTDSDFRSTTDLRAWGGEAQFTLAGGPGLNPYLTAGAGELTWGKAKAEEAPRPADQSTVILGGGVDFNFGPRIRATVAARDFVLSGSDLSASPDFNTATDPDELVHNWQFSAGLKFLVGRTGVRKGGGEAARPEPAAPPQERPAQIPEEAVAPVRPVPVQPPVQVVAPPAAPARRPGEAAAGVAEAIAPAAAVEPVADTVVRADTMAGKVAGGQTIVLPILDRGEIYIRFGEAGSVPLFLAARSPAPAGEAGAAESQAAAGPTLEDLRELIREELARQERAPEAAAAQLSALRDLEARLEARLAEIERAAQRAEAAATAAPAQPPTTVVVAEGAQAAQAAAAPARRTAGMARRVEELRPYSGFNLTGDFQLLLGLGVDLGAFSPGSSFNLVPQVAFGVGQGPASFLLSADVEYRLPEIEAGESLVFEPLFGAGPGLIKRDRTELELGVFLGTGLRLYKDDGSERLHLFGGVQGIDLFDATRLVVGLRKPR